MTRAPWSFAICTAATPDARAGGVHEHRLAEPELRAGHERVPGGHERERDGGGLHEREVRQASGGRSARERRASPPSRPRRARRGSRSDGRGSRCPRGSARTGRSRGSGSPPPRHPTFMPSTPGADRLDDARHVRPEHVREASLSPGQPIRTQMSRWFMRRRLHRDDDLARPGLGSGSSSRFTPRARRGRGWRSPSWRLRSEGQRNWQICREPARRADRRVGPGRRRGPHDADLAEEAAAALRAAQPGSYACHS